jgi:hypothetical protein
MISLRDLASTTIPHERAGDTEKDFGALYAAGFRCWFSKVRKKSPERSRVTPFSTTHPFFAQNVIYNKPHLEKLDFQWTF